MGNCKREIDSRYRHAPVDYPANKQLFIIVELSHRQNEAFIRVDFKLLHRVVRSWQEGFGTFK